METNLKDALEYAVQLSEDNKKTQEINGKTFVDVHRANFKSVEEIEKRRAQALKVSTLTGIVDYIQSGFDKTGTLMVHVASPKTVEVFSPLDEFRQREVILIAECQLSRFPFGRFLRQDEFIINMQSYMANHGADGGVWEYDAIEKIKQYLEISLQEEIEAGSIKIIA